jgi:hypothetical protein
MFQILGYFKSINNTLLADTPVIPDTNFSARGGTGGADHWIFTEPYDLHAAFVGAVTVTAAQFNDATLNAVNIPQIYPVNLGITPLTNPQVMDLRSSPVPLPLNEEIPLNISAGAGGAEDCYGLIWIKPRGNQGNDLAMPPVTTSTPRVLALVTASIVLTKGVWSPFVTLTFTNPLKGGAYQVNGAQFVVSNGLAFKLNFVKSPLYMGRKLWPGSLTEKTYGFVPLRFGPTWMGPYGRFNNFELPQLSVLGSTTTGATTYTGYLDMTYLGDTNSQAMP